MTQIAIVASGTRGDVQPYTALGTGLKRAGFHVRILTSMDFKQLVEGAGLTFCSTGESIEAMLQSDEWRRTLESSNFLAIVSQMNREMTRRAGALVGTLPGLLAGVDLMIAGAGGMMGAFSVAEYLNIPVVQAYVFPFTPTREFPGPLTPTLPFGKRLNRLSFHIARQMLWFSGRAGDIATRRALGMPRGSLFGPFGRLARARTPVLYGYSRHVLPQPQDWDEHHHVTGYWFLDEGDSWSPPSELCDFLAAGDAPVYIGFGSMGNRNPEETGEIVLQALKRAGKRGVLAAGWGGLSLSDLPETIYMTPSVPHSWLFSRMGAVVHHGGAGTTAAGLRGGVPSIVVPFMGDQPFWGRLVAELGAGPRPIPRKKLTADALAGAIMQSIQDTQMRQQASELGAKIRREQGIENAVRIIQRYLDHRSPT